MNIVTAIKSFTKPAKQAKPAPRVMARCPAPWVYQCETCDNEWFDGGYARSQECEDCGALLAADDNPLYTAYMTGRADLLNEQEAEAER